MTEDIKAAIEVLQKGGVILYPTDTGWGLGCDANNEAAVQRIYDLKKKQDPSDMTLLMENAALLDRYLVEVPEIAYDLIELSDQPLTIIFDGAKNVAANLMGGDGSISIRVTVETFTADLIRRFKRPIVFASANVSGKKSPSNFNEIAQEIIDAADYVVQYRQEDTHKDKASGIMRLGRGGEVKIVRE